MNILPYVKTVKPENLTNQEITDLQFALAQQLLYADTQNDSKFEKRWINESVWYYGLKIDNCSTKQNRCSHNTDKIYAVTPQAVEKKERIVVPPEEKFPIIKMCAEQGIEPIYFIKTICKQYLDTFRYISIEKDGEVFFIQQYQKGAERYQTKEKWEIIDFCKTADKKYKNCIFLTLTMAQNHYFGNFARAWKDFAKELSKFTQKLQRFMNCDYVWVKESTLKGFPHAHLLIYHNEDFNHAFKRKRGKKGQKYISGGEWFNFLKKAWTFGYFDSDVNRRKNTYNYLVKYIVKSAKVQFKNILKASRVKAEDTKDLLTIIMPIYSHTRGYQMSQMKISEEVKEERIKESEFLTERRKEEKEKKEREFVKSMQAREAGLAYLKSLSTNLEICNTRKIGFYTETKLNKETSGFAEKINDFPLERRQLIHNKYAKKMCNGCIKTMLVEYYSGRDKTLFEEKCNLDLLVGIIHHANKQISNFENVFQKSWSDSQKIYFYIDAFIKELNLKGTFEQITYYIHSLFYINPMLWVLFLPDEVASQFYSLRLQIDRNAVEKYKQSPYYGKLIDMFDDFFLTLSASGVKVA